MASRATTAIEHRRRLRRAFRHLEHRIRVQPDSWPGLAELANVACMSPFHFIRLYREAVLETPQSTVRRLKLRAAGRRLAQQRGASVTETALEFGYASPQTFARAFRREFGVAPGQRCSPCENATSVAFTALPMAAFRGLDARGESGPPWSAYDELVAKLALGQVRRQDQKVFGILQSRLDYQHACAADLGGTLRGLRKVEIGGGKHLQVQGHPDVVWPMIETGALAQFRDRGRSMILRFHNDPSFCESASLRISLYVPVEGGVRPEDVAGVAPSLGGATWLS